LPVVAKAPEGPAPTAQELARSKQLKDIMDNLHPVTGDVPIPQAEAVLHLGENYYYLSPAEARRVIVDAWGNPPDTAENVLGLVLPAGKTFLDDTWGAIVTWDPMGYVTDDDARTADYSKILADMQSGEDEINQRRRENNYPAQHLVGWAQPPSYDAGTHSVVWAQNIAFDGQPVNSLNYDVRLLGRKGVLSLNMLHSMDRLTETRTAAQAFARSAEFKPGARYGDYADGDTKAGIGIAGLVAAGVGVAVAQKAGLLAVVLIFAKKFLVIILALFAGLGAKLRNMFRRKRDDQDLGPAPMEADTLEAPPTAAEEAPRPTGQTP
jgi:uncharacterized membrane-anchored protein